MKPIQPHKDPRVTSISFENFTGSICIISPQSDDEAEDLMLSSAQNHPGADLFKPKHHLSLITQPVLGARSRKKDRTDSLPNSRRNSYNDASLLTLPIARHEKKTNFQESSDSGLDFSLSTNSSVQYSQQQPILHRPLSVLNEDSNPDDGFHDHPARLPGIHPGHHSNEMKTINEESNYHRLDFLQPPVASIQQHRSLNDLTKPSRKKTKLNIVIEPSISSLSSSRLNIHDEQVHSINRIPSSTSSSNQTTSQVIRTKYQLIKPKAITPLGHYPNQEQIRAHINRSVIERQHPSYLPAPPGKHHNVPFDSTKGNKLLTRPVKQPTNIYRSNPNIHVGNHPTRPLKPILPDLHHEERRLNENNKWHDKEPIRSKVKDHQEPLKTNSKHESFLTSTPRRHFEPGPSNLKGQQSFVHPKYNSKPTGFLMQNKTRIINPESEFPSRNLLGPFQSPSKKRLRIPNIEHPMNTNNIASKVNLMQLNKEQKTSNRVFRSRSPISWSVISEHYLESSLSPRDESNRTYRVNPTDGRHVIPSINPKPSIFVDCACQTSAPYTPSFSHTTDSHNDIDVDTSPPKVNELDTIEHRSCSSSSSIDRFSPHDRFPLPLGKLTVAMEEDGISTNYDSDDGWSDDSVELIYADERYLSRKKKSCCSSSSLFEQESVLLQ